MGVISVVKGVAIPALIALAIYLLLAYALVPFVHAYRTRYRQYLPLDAIGQRTSSLRTRAANTLERFILPASMRWRRDMLSDDHMGGGDDFFTDEDGERLVGFDVERLDREVRGGRVEVDSQRRLSRELEEGFKDDSDDEEEDTEDRRRG